MTAFSGQTDAPEVRCDLTDRQTDRPNYSNPRCACAPRVNEVGLTELAKDIEKQGKSLDPPPPKR